MLEKQIEKTVCDFARRQGLLVYKFTSPQRRAVPDRMFVCEGGHVFFIEFKAPKKKPTPLQFAEHQKLKAYGVQVWVVDDVEHGKGAILKESAIAKLL